MEFHLLGFFFVTTFFQSLLDDVLDHSSFKNIMVDLVFSGFVMTDRRSEVLVEDS
jgi:hypothetical protein